LAQQRLVQAEQIAARGYALMMMAMVTDEQVRLWLAQNRLREVSDKVRENPPTDESASLLARAIQQITWARCAIAQQDSRQVINRLTDLPEQLERAGMMRLAFQAASVLALAWVAERQVDEGLDVFARGVPLAEQEGYCRTFLDEGAPLRLLISDFRFSIGKTLPHLQTYLSKLLGAFQIENPQSKTENIVEPLTERELQVLRLVANGCSNQDIADQLVVALGTVKSHLSNIFGKLDAQNRTQAIARARALGLLSE